MISVEQAQQKIIETVVRRATVTVPLKEALGRVLAADINAPFDTPPFDNSAMDGYAVRAADTQDANAATHTSLKVTHTVAAGDAPDWTLQAGETARIFTGAMVPKGADAVIPQENVERTEDQIRVNAPVAAGKHIRNQGEELRKDTTVFQRGDALTSAGIGLLASLGQKQVEIFSPPRVGIIVTGSEIVTELTDYQPGKIFDSNSFALVAALQEMQLSPAMVMQCSDDKEALLATIETGFAESDFLIITGGVSVGDYDFVKEIAQGHGVEEIFWKVKQKPGKPIYFGKRNDTQYLIGLPGNPASALVCFYEYARIALLHAMGHQAPALPSLRCPLKADFKKKGDRAHFLRARFDGESVEILEQQGSHTMVSFAQANCLVILPEETNQVEAGESVTVHLLPGVFIKRGTP